MMYLRGFSGFMPRAYMLANTLGTRLTFFDFDESSYLKGNVLKRDLYTEWRAEQ